MKKNKQSRGENPVGHQLDPFRPLPTIQKGQECIGPDHCVEIQNSEQWYRRLLKTMNEGFTIRDENTEFSYVNDKFCEMLGYAREELLGQKIEDFVDQSGVVVLKEQLEKRKKGARTTYELVWLKKNGEKLFTIMSAAALFDAQGNFRGGFGAMTDITPRKKAEKKLLEYQNELRSMASELSLVEERERRRIAAELHDRIGQSLAMAKIGLGTLSELVDNPSIEQEIDKIKGLVKQTINDTRLLTVELSPPILYELGFEAAVEWFAEEFQTQHGIEVQFEDDSQPKPLNEDIRVILFKVVQELFFNVLKHAMAKCVFIKLAKNGKEILITFDDNGVGFNTYNKPSRSGSKTGFGLFSIRERLNHMGGHFQIKSTPGEGTYATISAPLNKAD